MSACVFVVDDKSVMRDPVVATLECAGYEVVGCQSVAEAREALTHKVPDCVVTDLSMPGETGIDLVAWWAEHQPECPVILMTAYATVETAVNAMKEGAYDYLSKPFDADELELVVSRALEHRRLKSENKILKQALVTRDTSSEMVGGSPVMQSLKEELQLVAASNATVLILGESGTGKEVLAREVHRLSPRKDKPFLAVNCAALSAGLLESELFGHEKGSFTGAETKRAGRFELANGGTLLLDEITEMDIALQSKLLRVLQEKVIERVGSSDSIPVDVRVIATSNRNPEEAVAEGHLRQDLFYRLNVVSFTLPPLRERKEDLCSLVQHFLNLHGGGHLKLTEEILDAIKEHSWPGNIRELGNQVERACVLQNAEALKPRVAQKVSQTTSQNTSGGLLQVDEMDTFTLEEMEKTIISRTLNRFEGRRNLTARQLGMSERTLRDKIKRWQLK